MCPNSIIYACGDCVRRSGIPYYAVVCEAGSPFFKQHVRVLRRGHSHTTVAFMTGGLKVEGSLGLALKLQEIVKKYQ